MKTTVPSVGDIIDARCSKCQQVTNHVVIALLGTKPAKVQCNTCHGIHRYRSPAPMPKPAKQGVGTPVVKQEEWAELQTAISNGLARDYDMEKEYRVGTVIRHPSFGLGLVRSVAGGRKMEVLFEAGRKTMRCK